MKQLEGELRRSYDALKHSNDTIILLRAMIKILSTDLNLKNEQVDYLFKDIF